MTTPSKVGLDDYVSANGATAADVQGLPDQLLRSRLPLAEVFERFGDLARGQKFWSGTCRLCGKDLTIAVHGFEEARRLQIWCASTCDPARILARADLTEDDLVTGDRDEELEAILHPPAAEISLVARSAADVIDDPLPVEIIEGLAWAGGLTALVAESGGGKTFIALSAAAAISDGVTWFGRRVRQGSVVYLSFEGDALGLRVRALREVAGRQLDHLYIARAAAPMSPRIDFDRIEHPSPGERCVATMLDGLREDLAATEQPPIRLIIIDTVRCSMTGSEDNSDAVASYLRAVRRVMTHAPDAGALLVHHAGWQDGESKRQRERGSSAWRGNVDATVYVEVGEDARLVLRALKVRDAERPAPLHLVRTRVDLSIMGPDGLPASSCLIDRDPRSREERVAVETAEAEAETRAVDSRVLKAIADRPEFATSLRQIRVMVALGMPVVTDSIARLVGRGWLSPGRRGEPYAVTDKGRMALSEPPVHA